MLFGFLIVRAIVFICKATLFLFFSFLLFYSCDDASDSVEPVHPRLDSILVVASDQLNSGQLNKSVNYLDSAFKTLNTTNPLALWKKFEFMTKIHLNYNFDEVKAKAYLDSMFQMINGNEGRFKNEYALTKFLEGDYLKTQKRYTAAFQSYFEGRAFAQKNLDSCQISQLTYQLGLFRYGQGQYREAIPYFEQAIEENNQCRKGSNLEEHLKFPQMYLNTLALCYEKTKELDSAAFYYQEALDFLEGASEDFPDETFFIEMATGVVYGNLGGVLGKLNNYGKAEELLLKSIELNDRPGYDRRDAQTAKIKIIDLYIQEEELEKAQIYLNQLEESLPQSEVKNQAYADLLRRWSRVKWEYFDRKGDINNAYEHMKAYQTLNDSLERSKLTSQVLDIETAFKNSEQQYQLSVMASENKINNIYLRIIIAFTLIAIAFLVVAKYNLNRSRGINKVISQQNLALQDTLLDLEKSQAENSKIMYVVAHDLRNPISSMVMMADLLLEDNQFQGENRMLLEHIKTSCDNSLNLVAEMMQSNKKTDNLKTEPVAIDKMLNYCVELLQHKAVEKNQRLILDAIPVTIKVCREKIWRVISNLIANAIKFSPKGSTIEISMKSQNDKIKIAVKDHGIGIPDEIKDKVFELYTEGKREGTDGEKPFGMGLAISKQIVNAHDGHIWFESVEGKGSTFFVELPLNR
jgi:signal transduction histidine kinase